MVGGEKGSVMCYANITPLSLPPGSRKLFGNWSSRSDALSVGFICLKKSQDIVSCRANSRIGNHFMGSVTLRLSYICSLQRSCQASTVAGARGPISQSSLTYNTGTNCQVGPLFEGQDAVLKSRGWRSASALMERDQNWNNLYRYFMRLKVTVARTWHTVGSNCWITACRIIGEVKSWILHSICAVSDKEGSMSQNISNEGLSAELQGRLGLPHGRAGIMRSKMEGH